MSASAWGAVYCHRLSHVYGQEYGAAEFDSGGATLLPLDGPGCRIDAADLEHAITRVGRAAVPACASLTQATEAGTPSVASTRFEPSRTWRIATG